MKQSSKAWGIAFFMGMMFWGNWAQAADNTVSTVDSQELFRSQLVKDTGNNGQAVQDGEAVDKAVENLPQLNSRFRWAAVKTPAELEEKQRAAQRQKKAIPIIITAADIDREKKAKKRGEQTDTPALITPRPLEIPKINPSQEAKPAEPQQAAPSVPQPAGQPQISPAVQAQWETDAIELPPVMPVAGVAQNDETVPQGQEVVELPPVESVSPGGQEVMAEALAEVMTIELVIDDIVPETVELPPVQPVP